ncbi:MAG: hypothetical protein Q8O04_07590 [Deltaproteobacteria bacterium]|nr:hypothetical protein [Deltaproteobacteria bacterium]
MAYRYHRRSRHNYYGSAHVSQRTVLSLQLGGIDKDIEKIFLSLSQADLEKIISLYSKAHGQKAAGYARATYQKWKSGSVKMSGQTAERLVELIPPVLPTSVRFELVKKLRYSHFKTRTMHVNSSPDTWRNDIIKPIQELVSASSSFSLPEYVLEKAKWLAQGDAKAAQQLLAAAEQEEAAIRLAYIDEELRRIEALIQNIDTMRKVTHTLKLPQGEVILRVELPPRTLMQKLSDFLR